MSRFHHNAENDVHSHNITQITEKQYYNRQRYKGFQTDGLFKAFFHLCRCICHDQRLLYRGKTYCRYKLITIKLYL